MRYVITAIIIIGVGILLFNSPEEIATAEVTLGDRTPVVIDNTTFTVSDLRFATSTDENEKEIKTGLVIPIRVATSTGFIDEEYTMNFDGYNQCRRNGKTKAVCGGELNDDIQQNIETFRINKLKELEEQADFKSEIDLTNL